MGKYARLQKHLSDLGANEWRPAFSQVEKILGFPLPASARSHPAWWANNRDHSHSSAWLDAGWETADLNLTGEWITFRRVADAASKKRPHKLSANHGSTTPLSWDTTNKLALSIAMQWTPIGRISLDDEVRLSFPRVQAVPGLYRLRIRSGGKEACYFGETENLARRFGNYRNPGPTQQTSLRINATLKSALDQGAEIAVATVTEAWIERNGSKIAADFTSKPVRRLFECAAIGEGGGVEVESLNR